MKNNAQELQQQSELLKQHMAGLNETLVQLGQSQAALGNTLQQSAGDFNNIGRAADNAAASLTKMSAQMAANAKSADASQKSLQQNKQLLADLQQAYDTLSKSQDASSDQLKSLGSDMDTLSKNITAQEQALSKSRETFDLHKASIDAIKSSLDQLKAANKDFGPVLGDVTKGFNYMKDGLALVKTGFNDVGSAIKTTGFGLLVTVLQSVVEYFTKTTEGAKRLRGGIAAISLVISTVKDAVSGILSDIGRNIINSFIHPADTIKRVWNTVIENLTNRFKGISVFFKGLLSANLKQMGDGLIQMGTGITDGTAKITNSFHTLKKEAGDAATALVNAYNKAAESSGDAVGKITGNNKKISRNLPTLKKGKTATSEKRDATELKAANPTTSSSDDNSLIESLGIPTAPSEQLQSVQVVTNTNPDDAIASAHNQGDWQTEFKLKQQQLDQEKKQAEDAAQARGASVLKVDQEFTEKQKQLEKAKLDAQFANQQLYLQSVNRLSGALSSIFGKNTAAARVAFKAHQAAAAGQVVIDTEKSIMGIWSADAGIPFIGVPKAIAETAIAAAAGAASLASIIKQKPGFAKGGRFVSDGRGALLSGYSRTDDTNAYLRSGEAVVVSEAMRNPWARNLVSAINVAHGGRDFSVSTPGRGYAIGGIFTDGGNANRYYSQPANNVKDLANTLAYQMINNFPPVYVDVKDINTQQNILAQTINRVNL
jgi:hypothetical protein